MTNLSSIVGTRVSFDRGLLIAEGVKIGTVVGRPLNNVELNKLLGNLQGSKQDLSTYECGGNYCSGAMTYQARNGKPRSDASAVNSVTISNVSQDFRFKATQKGQSFEVVGIESGAVRIRLNDQSGLDGRSVTIPYRSLSGTVTPEGLQVQINGKPLNYYFQQREALF